MRFHLFPMIFFVLLLVSGVQAVQTDLELNREADKAFRKADAELNVVYKQVLAKLDDEGKKKLQHAERAWLKFRDTESESESDDYRGGTISPQVYSRCAERLTKARTADLTQRLKVD